MNANDGIIDDSSSDASRRLQFAVSRWLDSNADTLQEWRTRSRGRRDLLDMEDHRLDDIGIDRSDALQEAAKPFWEN